MVKTRGGDKKKGKAVASSSGKRQEGEERPRAESSQPTGQAHPRKNLLQEALNTCEVHATRFIDWETMTLLGVNADLEMLFTAMGINHYMHTREFTHVEEALQFFGTLKRAPPQSYRGGTFEAIRFEIHKMPFIISTADLRDIYGFTDNPMRLEDVHIQEGMLDLWHRLAGGTFRMGKSKSSLIRNPAIKLAQRALGFTFFGRPEVGTVTAEEWRMLCHALRPLVADLEPPVRFIPQFDPATLFMANLLRMVDLMRRKKPDDWPFCVGGTLTPIFRHCGIRLTPPLTGIPLIDMVHLRRCYFLSRAHRNEQVYTYTCQGVDQTIALPDQRLTSLSVPGNILFEHILADDAQADTGVHDTAPQGDTGPHHDDDTQDEPPPPFDGTQGYGQERYLHPWFGVPRTPMEKELVRHVGVLQRWNRWQDRNIRNLVDAVKKLKKRTRRLGYPSSSSDQETSDTGGSSNPTYNVSTPSFEEDAEDDDAPTGPAAEDDAASGDA